MMVESLLKKAGGNRRENNRNRNHRVVFNETKNEFFDADYIILIREECDFDDEDDESVCTCYQHEMVRLTCCEPNCNCNVFEEFESPTPQSPKFAPPLEFVDAVTLSPPEGYKDMELEEKEMLAYSKQLARRGTPRAAVCKECSASNDYEGEQQEEEEEEEEQGRRKGKEEEKETEGQSNHQGDGKEEDKIDQSQQTTPTSPNNGDINSMDTNESRQDEAPSSTLPTMGSPVSGILKGGKLWRQQSAENNALRANELTKTDSTSDEEGSGQRTVRFIEAEEKKDSCKSSPDEAAPDADAREVAEGTEEPPEAQPPTEMTLTFKLGNHVLVSNNSLKPNSAVRQLFPCTAKQQRGDAGGGAEQYLVTAESLRAFEEAKRSKLPQVAAHPNDSIKRVIERNALRRSLVRYEPKSRRNVQKTDNSLVERIKQLTCDVDDEAGREPGELSARVSPTGEEGHNHVETNQVNNKYKDRNFSPSSSSTTSSNSSSMSSTYRKITDLFGKRERPEAPHEQPRTVQTQTQTLPDIAGPFGHDLLEKTPSNPHAAQRRADAGAEGRKQFLSTLAPLTACVSNLGNPDEHYYHLSNQGSLNSSTGSEYTLEDIEDGLQNDDNGKKITPDVLAGTPASESGDELAVFVQQDANRIERIRKKYESDQSSRRSDKDEDEDQDDYGFNRRPSVRGIKPRFGSTTEILQHIQNQIHLPAPNANVSWPYYSETGINREDDSNRLNVKMSYQQQQQQQQQQYLEEKTPRGFLQQQYRPENLYQNCTNQGCYKEVYKAQSYIEIDCNDYQTAAKARNGTRALSPPPQELSKTYHQTMVYIPYNHIEGYQPVVAANVYQSNDYYRYNQNQINKKYIDQPYYQAHPDEQFCNSNAPQQALKAPNKPPYPNNYQQQPQHLMAPSSRSESPLGNFSMARATQTSVACMSNCGYYQGSGPQLRYRGSLRPPQQQWKGGADYPSKVNRHSFPSVRPRYPGAPQPEYASDDPQQNPHLLLNGYYNYQQPKESPAGSPTKSARFIERGVPEGAASVSPQDSVASPTVSSHTVTNASGKPLFYAMNV